MTIRRSDGVRFVGVTDANIRENHLYLTGHFDFFPTDSYGPPSKKSGTGHLLQLHVEGLPEPIWTDIPSDGTTSGPRRFFRERSWVGRFFRWHGVRAGDEVAIERKSKYVYAVRPEFPEREFTVGELFAGIGLVRLSSRAA